MIELFVEERKEEAKGAAAMVEEEEEMEEKGKKEGKKTNTKRGGTGKEGREEMRMREMYIHWLFLTWNPLNVVYFQVLLKVKK